MINLHNEKENCCGCTACMNICPTDSITMEEDEEGFLYPVIDTKTCVECGACVRVCAFHIKAYEEKIPKDQKVYGVKHQDLKVRKMSSSGGAFTAISDYVLNRGGVVYGAVFNDSFEVIHSKALNEEQRNKMRGSKYVQSNLGTIFGEIRTTLETGQLVLFTGTPCQTGGLKSFLGKEYPNLILCDIVCHGVPSPKIWKDYKTLLEIKYQDKINGVNFRNKDSGWQNSSLKVTFSRYEHKKSMQEDPYYILFFNHLIIRPSCHQCVYASYHRVTDITLADFWGIESSYKTFQDDIGVTLVLINSTKGKELVENIRENTDIIESSHAGFYQPIFETPSKMSPNRQLFWEEYLSKGYAEVISKYGKLSSSQWLIKKMIVPVLKKTGLYNLIVKIYFK
ncbi:MAG: Coenzyme F420 hydrogenase/dehydrogenase, beta subunit C-terminal domain [Anaerocolumna sp.]